MRRIAASIAGAFAMSVSLCATSFASPVTSATNDVALKLLVDGRPVDSRHADGVLREGVAYVDVVSGVRAVGGTLHFGKRGEIRIAVRGRTLDFAIGRKSATLDSGSIRLAGAPFVESGDIFVPMASVATLAEAKFTLDTRGHRALFALGRGEGFAPAVVRAPASEEIAPSPTQALRFATIGTIDASGLHARVEIANTTEKPYVLSFPSARQISFVVSRSGSEIWRSADAVIGTDPSTLTIPAHGTIVVTSDYADFATFGPGRYLMRVRIMTQFPIDITPISLGVIP